MNALEIIEQVRAHNAEVVVENDQLIVRGRGERLPQELRAALKRHKAELLVALGAPREVGVLEVLAEIRPYLPEPLRSVPDASLLALVNWSMLHAWGRALAEFDGPQKGPPCRECGTPMSTVRVSDICGRCALKGTST
jgi:hypothetical protein